VDEPCAHTSHFIGADGRTHSAAAERYAAIDRAGGNGSGQRDHIIRVVVSGAQMRRTEIYNPMASGAQQIRDLFFQNEPSVVRSDSYAHDVSSF
jgi:hypothetical protein